MEGTWLREAEFLDYTMPFGIPRLLGLCDEDADLRATECNFHTARESVAEIKAFSESAAETAATGSLGDIPLAVLSHDPDKPQPDLPEDLVKPTNDAWQKMQHELAHLSTRGTQVIAKNSAHYIQLDRPDLVIAAVRQVVDQAHHESPARVHSVEKRSLEAIEAKQSTLKPANVSFFPSRLRLPYPGG